MHNYSLDGLLNIASSVPLPELGRFRSAASDEPPAIRVTVGRDLSPGDQERTRTGRSSGGLGFTISIARRDDNLDVVASSLLRHSPHVLYTNVVESMIRWQFVTRGYALMHGACVAVDGNAFLITARTDTGPPAIARHVPLCVPLR